ncbi:hypothetical protein E2C01_061884 [Portunus trituberculatus]|uniref:Uncharacterized protein n=1 Tax=Portunus trituberculatus TaxID=210409 RepID=A0A5B7HGJ7_PORTR|nr:hypothetical protein [Portunus trituberculatus]
MFTLPFQVCYPPRMTDLWPAQRPLRRPRPPYHPSWATLRSRRRRWTIPTTHAKRLPLTTAAWGAWRDT